MNIENKLIVLVGLPRSGKSTFARSDYSNGAIVNRDNIRLAAHGHIFRSEAEPLITFIETTMVRSLMMSGTKEIIIDATNTLPSFRNKWRILAKEHLYKVEFACFKTSPEECIERAIKTGKEELIPIIEKMSGYITFPGPSDYPGWELEEEIIN